MLRGFETVTTMLDGPRYDDLRPGWYLEAQGEAP
jgi:hypothetical protein